MQGFLNLAWLLPVPPFLAFVAIILFLNRNKTVSGLIALGGVLVSFIIGWPIAFAVFTTPHFGEHPLYGELFTIPTGMSSLLIGYQVDPANAIMLFMVCFLLLMIFIYSGDVIMFAGMMLLYMWSVPSTLTFEHVLAMPNLEHLASMTLTIPLLGITTSALAVIAVLIFFGTIGKSAQFPLHVWLPDAMEGPTPVSAMIHAATMVSAGVFLVVRMYPLYYVAGETTPNVMEFVALIGAFTALFASFIAVAQWDIKRVLAYSTIAQLGYMVAALGTGAYLAGFFHLITHAFFKGLLFMGSGSVIHGVEHGMHEGHAPAGDGHDDHGHAGHGVIHRKDGDLDPNDPQDMRNMGGLLRKMPITGWTFIIGGLALAGFPFISAGFWSKDEIFSSVFHTNDILVFVMLALSALLTAFYTARQITLTFLAKPRTEGAAHAHESNWLMTLPLILIAPFAVALGWFGIPKNFPLIGGIVPNFFENVMETYIEYQHIEVPHPEFNILVLATSLLVSLGGLALGWFVYRRGLPDGQIDPLRRWLGPVWWAMHRKFWVDELYNYTIVPFTRGTAKFMYLIDDVWVIDPIINAIGIVTIWIAKFAGGFDRYVIDGVVNALGTLAAKSGNVLRNIQNGQVQVYLMVLVVSITIWLLLTVLPAVLTLV
ncbi:MAG: hypothetical protein IPK16_25500 [Anaerolineales bacterium]|nr:hypothetical protein [Anaerolineales bacterium]